MPIDRRSFLIGTGAAFSLAGAARADDTAVVIIGAGAAGIARRVSCKSAAFPSS